MLTRAVLLAAVVALGACSGKADYAPPVDPMLPGDGYHLRTGGPAVRNGGPAVRRTVTADSIQDVHRRGQ